MGEVLKVREAMVTSPVTIRPNAFVYEAAREMRDKEIGSVICVDKDKVLGVVTERDLVRRVLAEDRDPKKVKVSDVMTTPVVSIHPEEDIVDAAQFMSRRGLRRLVVMEGDRLVGIITSDDLALNMRRAAEEFATTLYILGRRK